VTGIQGEPISAEMLATGEPLELAYDRDRGYLHLGGLPVDPPHRAVNVAKVVFAQPPGPREDAHAAEWVDWRLP